MNGFHYRQAFNIRNTSKSFLYSLYLGSLNYEFKRKRLKKPADIAGLNNANNVMYSVN